MKYNFLAYFSTVRHTRTLLHWVSFIYLESFKVIDIIWEKS